MSLQPFRQMSDTGLAVAGAGATVESPQVRLDLAIRRAVAGVLRDQSPDGYWCYEFEADCTIPSEYVLMMHFMDEVDEALERKIAAYLRGRQDDHGGWALYPGGELDVSASVKAYFALKLIGDHPDEPHMVKAREAVLARGGAANANVFTHITLALFEQIPWRGVPFIPVEIMLLPEWFPFHISKVSYWSRTVMVPLFVLTTMKPRAANPGRVDIYELFAVPPHEERHYFPVRSGLNRLFLALDWLGRRIEPFVPGIVRRKALERAERFVTERLNGEHGLGGIFPAMVNAHEMYATLGYPAEHPLRRQTRAALASLLVVKEDYAYCQPCLSPVWDTGLACLALQEATGQRDLPEVVAGLDWLAERQLLDEPGDWQWRRPHLRGGGWAFEFRNDHYPDIDDTPVIAWAMLNSGEARYAENVARAAEWIAGMQSSNGGWGSFDVDNTHYYLNEIPFADHGALLDPPTSDVTARCVTFLTMYDRRRFAGQIEAGIRFLREEQEASGAWFGRWGTNYIYGTWSVLTALREAGVDTEQDYVRRAVAWLESIQRPDGGWGETNFTYFAPPMVGQHHLSTAFQTAWAVIGLMMAGEAHSQAVDKGVAYLLRRQRSDGVWHDEDFNAPGFPRVFYLKYHGYTSYFPLWALALYRNRATL